MMIPNTINEKNRLVFLSLSLIITSLILSLNMASYKVIPSAFAQTNAAMIASLAANNNSIAGVITNIASVSSSMANTSTEGTSNTAGGLQI